LNVESYGLYSGMTYRKKSFYGNASLHIESNDNDAMAYVNQFGNELVVNGVEYIGLELDVDQLYAQGPMEKIR
jgi:hypothetical protein